MLNRIQHLVQSAPRILWGGNARKHRKKQASKTNKEADEGNVDLFERLGIEIQDLLEFITPRHNVHGSIKTKVNAICVTYNNLAIASIKQGQNNITKPVLEVKHAATQTAQSSAAGQPEIVSRYKKEENRAKTKGS